MKYIFSILLLLSKLALLSQEIVLPPAHIRSVQLKTSKIGEFIPIISLNSRITLSFDDLEADEKDYYYKIEHCDRNWETSDINETEFIKGYAEEQIQDYENSFNTLQDYTNYKLSIPNENTKIIISGNYRLSILDENDEVVFTRYFIVYEPLLTIGVSVHRSRDVNYIDTQQTVHFSINHPNFRINNPRAELFPVIIKNGDFSTSIKNLKPQFTRGDQLLYKYDSETSFWGGNEFLYFETKEVRYSNMTVAKSVTGEHLYHSYLFLDKDRSNDVYTYFPDTNGGFVIRKGNSPNSRIEADYSIVHFALDVYEELQDKEVYVYGGFNNYQLTDENRMYFNPETEHYELARLFKQGFYNYTYVTLNDSGEIDETELNGSHNETENSYSVLVYYSKIGSYYDRIIGYGKGSSKQMQN